MKLYRIDTCPMHDPDLHILEDIPDDIAHFDWNGSEGLPFGKEYASGISTNMARKSAGNRLGGLIANTFSFLIVRKEIRDLICEFDKAHEHLEVVPLSIRDRKGRPSRGEYFIINPLGSLDCIDYDKSDVEWDSAHEDILAINSLVIRQSALDQKRAVFRVQGYPYWYIARGDWLVEAKNRLTDVPRNLYVTEIPLS